MRLINFGAGEVSDRLSILSLKILHGEAIGKDTSHWRNERNALLTKLTDRLTLQWADAYIELAVVNAAIWQGEDEIRAYRLDHEGTIVSREALWEDTAKLAYRIQALNDRRAVLIEQINKSSGEHLGTEKLT